MDEQNGKIQSAESAPGSETGAELARVRSRNKILKIAAAVLSVLFLSLLGAVIFLYLKVSAFRDVLMPQTETFQDSAFGAGEEALPPGLPAPFRVSSSSVPAPDGSALTVFTNSGEYAQEEGGITLEDGERAAKAFSRYAERPIVKAFMAELKKDPAFVQALKEKDANAPLAMMSSIQKSKGIQVLAAKFAMRRDFIPFMMEVMNDPDLKPLLGKLPMGGAGSMAQMLRMLPASGGSPQSDRSAVESSGTRTGHKKKTSP
ncbi:MAG: hypothetical protein A2X28_05645 [Elusimicrobia bacterium GWA2_56_46]|nr:MAG: hypothetical protein A2X28_05645 [Elusimicrobia bacterium GWA2_56_46]OGR53937.1 MAG: hypothetical protein A2X39_07340 [Elusimicrobia bacterium GWC2_56_31]HBB68077.1 hypothetical protein [Elusimicrobiota bacterium]HBW23223.1 hypothetical protein [Elusimicrobiota bacterium]